MILGILAHALVRGPPVPVPVALVHIPQVRKCRVELNLALSQLILRRRHEPGQTGEATVLQAAQDVLVRAGRRPEPHRPGLTIGTAPVVPPVRHTLGRAMARDRLSGEDRGNTINDGTSYETVVQAGGDVTFHAVAPWR